MAPWLAPVAASIAGSIIGGKMASDRQEDAQSFNAEQFATRYQTTTKDMLAAGLNPMLAYSQGGGAGASSSAAGADSGPNLGSMVLQSRMNAAQVANIEADTENKKASAALIEAQTAQANASAGQATAQTGLISQTVEKVVQEIKNLKSEEHRINAAADQLRHHAELLRKQGLNATDIGNNLRATLNQINAQTDLFRNQSAVSELEAKLKRFDVEAATSAGNLGREFGQYGGTLKILIDVLKTLK